MYSNEQSRINATISYFFLGPLFLLAKKNTPLADPYVRGHALRASSIIGVTLLAYILYFFLRPYIDFSFSFFDLRTVIVTLIMGICSIFLIHGAYRAFHGDTHRDISESIPMDIHHSFGISDVYSIENEEDKVRILASLLPWFGIYLSKKYNHPLMIRGRIVGSTMTLLIILSLFLTGTGGFLTFVLVSIYILIFVIEGVYLFIYNRFLSLNVLDKLPSYDDIEAHIIASLRWSIDFFRVVFGKEKKASYQIYLENAKNREASLGEVPPYFMPGFLIGLPIWNIFCIPSLFIKKYSYYRANIIDGMIITFLFILTFFLSTHLGFILGLLLVFPIVHMMTHVGSQSSPHTPIIGLWHSAVSTISSMRSTLIDMDQNSEKVAFRYDVAVSSPDTSQDTLEVPPKNDTKPFIQISDSNKS